jgi:cell division protein ZapA (FtsZ GTPase activity inhibitor)
VRPSPPELVAIQIHGREIRIRSDEPRAHLEALARYVDERLVQIAGPKKVEPADPNLLLIAALQLADEIFKLKSQQQELAAKLRSSTRSLLGRLDGVAGAGGSARMGEPTRPRNGAGSSAPKG